MVAFGHTAVGAGIGLIALNYYHGDDAVVGLSVTFGVATISHYIADFIPHGHFFKANAYNQKIIYAIIFDLFLSVVITLGIVFYREGFDMKFLYVLVGISGSQLPDIVDGLIYTKVLPNKGLLKIENTFHNRFIHWHGIGNKALMWGQRDIWQISIAAVVLTCLTFL